MIRASSFKTGLPLERCKTYFVQIMDTLMTARTGPKIGKSLTRSSHICPWANTFSRFGDEARIVFEGNEVSS